MIGIEAFAPRSSNHSKLGASDPISASGGSRLNELALKQKLAAEQDYARTVIPKRYNGMYASLSSSSITDIVKLRDKEFGIELARAMPHESVDDFVANKGHKHTKPIYRPTKPVSSPEKPGMWRRFAYNLTFGYAYKKEMIQYKQAQELFKIQHRVMVRDEERMGAKQTIAQSKPSMRKLISRTLKHTLNKALAPGAKYKIPPRQKETTARTIH